MPKKRSSLQIKLEFFAVRLVIGAIGLFPLGTSIKIGEKFAGLFFKFFKRLRFVGLRNLEIALPELSGEKHEKILKGSFESMGRQLGIVSHFARFTPEKLRELVDVEGLNFLEEAQSKNRGVILFSGHFGGWELSIPTFSAFGFDWSVLVRRIDNPLIENYVEALRTHLGARTIDKKTSARAMFRILQNNERLGILADLNTQENEGVFVDFFGVPASTSTGLARLALRTNSMVLPFFTVWQKDKKRYLLKVCPPIELPLSENAEENTRILTQRVTNKIEEYVRLYPDQWMWIHKRWNTRPPGEANLYAKDFQAQSLKSEVQNQVKLESQG